MPRTLFIHIGLPKTGSTAIQNFCRDNAKAGTERLVHNHAGLVWGILNPPLLAKLRRELHRAGRSERVPVSDENLAARLGDPGYFAANEIFCRDIGDEPHPIAYLRPQPAAINFYYIQQVKICRQVSALPE